MRLHAYLPGPVMMLCACHFSSFLAVPDKCPAAQLKVGVYECPPFVMKNEEGAFIGLSIMLWEKISEDLKVDFVYEERELEDLLTDVSRNRLDLGVSCISITSEREQAFDFSHSFYETHLAIAVRQEGYVGFVKALFTNKKLLMLLGIVCGTACMVGGIFYLLEHNINEKLYSMRSTGAKLVEGFLLGLLFITKGPFSYYEFKTLPGRVITVFLAVATTLFIASITAVLASSFTLGLLKSNITGPKDLAKVSVGVKSASTSAEYLSNLGIIFRDYESTEELLEALDRGWVNAVVADDAVLRYQIKRAKEQGKYSDLTVLPYQFEKQNYGFALTDNSPVLEEVNQDLLEVRKSRQWQQTLNRYFAE